MGKTTVLPKVHFGRRILQLLGERQLSLREAHRRSRIPYRTLQNWVKREDPPRSDLDRVARLEAVLGGSLTEESEPMKINESRLPYGEEPRRYVQPLDFKKRALDDVGRARHELSAVLALIEEGASPVSQEVAEHLEKADFYCSKAQRRLMGKIKVNDQGEPV